MILFIQGDIVMDKIYKYVPLESGLNILSNNSVKLNNPQNYNVPFQKQFSNKVHFYLIILEEF